jgi:uncharacterized cupredoxin-like copper-binding protein
MNGMTAGGPMPRTRLLGTLAASLVTFALGCAAEDGHGPGGLATATPAQTLALELRDIAFSESRLEARTGAIVDLELRNDGALAHDFTIERMPVDAYVSRVPGRPAAGHEAHGPRFAVHGAPGQGERLTIRLHTHEAGEFTYYCSVPGHREAGMTGTLVVS